MPFRDTFLDEELHMAIAWKTVKLWEKHAIIMQIHEKQSTILIYIV